MQSRRIPFEKYVSIGNDFVLVERENLSDGDSLQELAKKMCDRNFGIGSDGLLVFERSHDGKTSMRMFNPDGAEDFCGNGLRCAALHAQRKELAKDNIDILHCGEIIPIEFSMGNWLDVQLPKPSFSPGDVPLARDNELFDEELEIAGHKLRLCALATGSTHTVVLCDAPPREKEFQIVGPALELHPMFPQRTSVIWAWLERFNKARIRIWERGVGETQGCGTGSAAVAACHFRLNPNIVAMEVHNPGGECAVAKGPGGTLITSARAKHVYSGEFLL